MLAPVIEFPQVTTIRRRGKNLSRRIGQNGSVFQRGFARVWNPAAPAYGRFWTDTPAAKPPAPRRFAGHMSLTEHCPAQTARTQYLHSLLELQELPKSPYFRIGPTANRAFMSLARRRRQPVAALMYGVTRFIPRFLLDSLLIFWWTRAGSSRRPPRCERGRNRGLFKTHT
jgi:hypothetical protein